MTNLKILKDLKECFRGYPHICEKHPEDCEYKIDFEELRKEAINWIKELEKEDAELGKYKEIDGYIFDVDNTITFIKYFFNLEGIE